MENGKYIKHSKLTVGKLIEILNGFPANRLVAVKTSHELGQDDDYDIVDDRVDIKGIDYSRNVVWLETETTCE